MLQYLDLDAPRIGQRGQLSVVTPNRRRRRARGWSAATLLAFAVIACGGSTEPNACPICGTWYLRYDPGLPVMRDPQFAMVLKPDFTFTQALGVSPPTKGWFSASSTQLTLQYDYSGGYPDRGTPFPVATIAGDSITFAPSVYHATPWVYKR